jgi:hypothetical protein
MAIYYVKWDATGAANGTSWTDAYTTITAAITAHHAGTETYEISGGTSGHPYPERVTTQGNCTIIGSTAAGHNGLVTISGDGVNDSVTINHSVTINNLAITGSPTNKGGLLVGGTGTVVANDLNLHDNYYNIWCNQASGSFTGNRIVFSKSTVGGYSIYCHKSGSSTATCTINNFKVLDSGWIGAFVNIYGTVTLNNGLISRSGKQALYAASNSPATVIANNVIMVANGLLLDGSYIVTGQSSVGTTTLNNCLTLTSPKYPSSMYQNSPTVNTSQDNKSPQFVSNAKPGILVIQIDDYGNLADWQTLCATADKYGVKVDLALNTLGVTSGDYAAIAAQINKGHGVCSHSRRHVSINTPLNAFNIQSSKAGAITMTIDTTGTKTLKTFIDGTQDLSIDLNSSYPQVKNIVTYIAAQSGYTCTNAAGTDRTNALSLDLADISSPQDIKTTVYPALLDTTKFIAEELAGSKADIEAGIGVTIPGYVCKTFVPPSSYTDATAQGYLQTAVYSGARGLGTFATPVGSRDLSNISVFNINYLLADIDIGTANIVRNISALCEWMSETGAVVIIFDHALSAYSLANWETIFQTAAKSNVQFKTLSGAIDYIVANGSTADGGVTYTRTLADLSDLHLAPGSPCINTGNATVAVPGVTKGINDRYFISPDIGAYPFENTSFFMF